MLVRIAQFGAEIVSAIDDVIRAFAEREQLFSNIGENLPRLLTRMGFDVVDAFASFPIDWFLFHPGSNYVRTPGAGKATHQARMALDLVMAEKGLAAFHGLAEALLACGTGRSLSLIARPKAG